MKANHLSIMTLEEHEPNPEFIGRNFNAGEIIQLVLRAPYSGQWLSFRSVQMVMMHELAHCMQMNHSKAFWKVRNQFAGGLKELWGKGYTGDGVWGRGQTLLSGEYDTGNNMENEVLPRNLCGGTFRSSRGKRKRNGGGEAKKTETYAERQQRRIAKKFGVNGEALGGDQETRVNLEKGQKVKGKPRVANSSRGRELRVAAALARFGQQKEEAKKDESDAKAKAKEDEESGSSTEDDYEEVEGGDKAFDLDGSRIRDGAGRGMIRVCEYEDQDDDDVKQETDELHQLDDVQPAFRQPDKPTQQLKAAKPLNLDGNSWKGERETHVLSNTDPTNKKRAATDRPRASTPECQTAREHSTVCPICLIANALSSMLCVACSHVLDTSKITRFWRCQSDACKDSLYINAADCGICGVCATRKPAAGPE